MDHCPPLDDHTVIEVTREGGLAYLPALQTRQRFVLAELADARRGRLSALVRQLLPLALPPEASRRPGSGDERYFRIRICRHQESPPQDSDVELLIPESCAPAALVDAWRDGQLAD